MVKISFFRLRPIVLSQTSDHPTAVLNCLYSLMNNLFSEKINSDFIIIQSSLFLIGKRVYQRKK